jgi:hypothetical protein
MMFTIDQERHHGGHGAQRVDRRRGDGRRQALQFERQRVDVADGLRGAGDLVPAQREAEHADADHRRPDQRQHHVAEGLPGRGAEVARRFLVGRVEAVEHREHDQQAEGQRPGQVGARAPT